MNGFISIYYYSFFELPKILQMPVGKRALLLSECTNLTNKEQELAHNNNNNNNTHTHTHTIVTGCLFTHTHTAL